MRNKIETAKNILGELLNFMPALALLVVIFRDFVKVEAGMGRLMLLAVLPVLFYISRVVVRKPVPFFVLHILVWSAVTFLYAQTSFEKVIFAMVAGVFAGLSIHRRLIFDRQGSEVINPIIMSGALFAFHIVDGFQADGKSSGYLLQIMILYLGMYFLYYYLQQVLKFVNINCRVTENVPVQRLVSSSLGMILLFVLAVVLLLFFSVNKELIDELVAKLVELIRRVIRFVTSFFSYESEITIDVQRTEKQEGGMALPMAEKSAFAEFLDILVYIGGSLVLLAAVLSFCSMLYKLIRNAFRQSMKGNQKGEEFVKDKVESIKREKSRIRRGNRGNFFATSPEQVIRKIYYKTMSHTEVIGKDVSARDILSGTARENCKKYFVTAEDKTETIKERAADIFCMTYEKARYSNAVCNKEDIKQMKSSRELLLKK